MEAAGGYSNLSEFVSDIAATGKTMGNGQFYWEGEAEEIGIAPAIQQFEKKEFGNSLNIRHGNMAYAGGMIAPRQRKRWNNQNLFIRKATRQKQSAIQRFTTWIREVFT